jgi:hypothetical protein
MTRRARRWASVASLVSVAMVVAVALGVLAGDGSRRAGAVSAGCALFNSMSDPLDDTVYLGDLAFEDGDIISVTFDGFTIGSPTSWFFIMDPVHTGFQITGSGAYPGTFTYKVLETGVYGDVHFGVNPGQSSMDLSCTPAPQPPTSTPTATPTKTPTPSPTPIPGVAINPVRGIVNSTVRYSVTGFPHNASVAITWRRVSGATLSIATVNTNSVGAVSGSFRVPATPGGPNQRITFKSGTTSRAVLYEVVPRVKVNTTPAVRGQYADVSLRGYARYETVRIRWKKGTSWITLATVVTSSTGSKNVPVKVPLWAPNGLNSVRGDGTTFRAQTNSVLVSGGPFNPAAASASMPTPTMTPSPSPPATATTTPTVRPTIAVSIETPSPEPSATPSSTAEPTMPAISPIETTVVTPTAGPTETVSATG